MIIKKSGVFKVQLCYMKYTMLKKHRTHREQVIKMFQSTFQENDRKLSNIC